MRKVIKWIAVVVGVLIGVLLLALLGLYGSAQLRLNRTYSIEAESLSVPADAASIERGRHLVEAVAGCQGCHGEDLGGDQFFSDPAIGAMSGANLTPGVGGIGDHSTDELVLAIRHGIHDGRGILGMPAESYNHLSERDLGAIIAYLRSLPPVDREVPEPRLTFLANVLVSLGAFKNPIPAENVDHTIQFAEAPPAGSTAEYGAYLAPIAGCTDCHAEDLGGGQSPEPGAPFAPNLTPGGEMRAWTEADFVHTMRTGVTPGGHEMGEFMPWEDFAKMSGEELTALWAYLQSVPAVQRP